MNPMGVAPPRSKEVNRIKAEIWAEQCNQRNKYPMSQSTTNDQLGPAAHEPPERGYFDCCRCGEPYKIISSEPIPPLIHDGTYANFWCEACFREYARELLEGGGEDVEG